ncbi:hypothetical protein TREES_T100002869 [Tupaia chinensis]|uniref:Uncharacterized protein n=1 Tax=Tupaia chinensis TaxID=246437 RepID=L9KVE7_TUPCH|nr:hypothetical protein TREES_T100002869 [Tupaia chinensis]
MSSTLLTRWLFVPPATFAASLIHSSPGLSPAFMLQGSSCQQLCQMAPLKVMGCPDRLAPPSVAAFGRDGFPFWLRLLAAPDPSCQKDDLTHHLFAISVMKPMMLHSHGKIVGVILYTTFSINTHSTTPIDPCAHLAGGVVCLPGVIFPVESPTLKSLIPEGHFNSLGRRVHLLLNAGLASRSPDGCGAHWRLPLRTEPQPQPQGREEGRIPYNSALKTQRKGISKSGAQGEKKLLAVILNTMRRNEGGWKVKGGALCNAVMDGYGIAMVDL